LAYLHVNCGQITLKIDIFSTVLFMRASEYFRLPQ